MIRAFFLSIFWAMFFCYMVAVCNHAISSSIEVHPSVPDYSVADKETDTSPWYEVVYDKPSVVHADHCDGHWRLSQNAALAVRRTDAPAPGPVDLGVSGFANARWDPDGFFRCDSMARGYTLVFGGNQAHVCVEKNK